jgi:uncharacterized protein YjbI with pentapeptide repeats
VIKATNLSGASLLEADFGKAKLHSVDLGGADLRRAVFRGAQLEASVLTSAKVHRADFVEVRMDLRRGNLIGLTAVAFVPPICLTILWRRMRGRRHSQSEERRR